MAFTQEGTQPDDEDEMVVDDFGEEEELEALFESYEEQRATQPSPTLSDEEYDDIFAELISQEQIQPRQPHSFLDRMETPDENMDIT